MEMYKRDEVMACDWFSDLYTNGILPSESQVSKWNDEHYFDGFAVRQAYITRFSFPLITKEVIAELVAAIKSLPYMGAFLKYLNSVAAMDI